MLKLPIMSDKTLVVTFACIDCSTLFKKKIEDGRKDFVKSRQQNSHCILVLHTDCPAINSRSGFQFSKEISTLLDNRTAPYLPRTLTLAQLNSCYRNCSIQFQSSQRSNAKTYVTSGCQCLENLYRFKTFTQRSS